MHLPLCYILDICLAASEWALAFFRRSRPPVDGTAGRGKDRGSMRLLWVVISLSLTLGHTLAFSGVGPYLTPGALWRSIGVAVFAAGAILRFMAIRHLGRFFTVDVAIADDHRVVSDGPFRFVRHPSYSGLLLELAGIAFTLQSVTSWLVIMVPIFLALLRRVNIEETALLNALGEPYAAYRRRTQRFVPGIF